MAARHACMCAGALLALSAQAAFAPKAAAKNLEEVLATTYLTSPRLDGSFRQLRAVEENIAIACGGYRPSLVVNGSAGYTDFTFERRREDESDTLQSNELSLSLEQNIYRGGRTEASVRSARHQIERQKAIFDVATSNLLLDGVTVYANLLRDQKVLDAAGNNVIRLEEQLVATGKRRKVGEATRTDTSQAEARLAQARADLALAQANYDGSIADYRLIVGEAPVGLEAIEPPVPSDSLESALDLVDNNYEVIAAIAQVARADADIDTSSADLLPRLDAVAQLVYSDDPTVLIDRQRDARVRLQLSVPLYQGGSEHAAVRQFKQIRIQRRNELENLRREVTDRVTRSFRQWQAAQGRVQQLTLQVEANRAALDGVEREVIGGTRLILDELDAQQELFNSQVALERALSDRVINAYGVLAATGQLTPQGLNLEGVSEDIRGRIMASTGCRILDFGTGIGETAKDR
ncbi:MAG: TolC family outer membrane protein [Geminicoccaceae bacterium]